MDKDQKFKISIVLIIAITYVLTYGIYMNYRARIAEAEGWIEYHRRHNGYYKYHNTLKDLNISGGQESKK